MPDLPEYLEHTQDKLDTLDREARKAVLRDYTAIQRRLERAALQLAELFQSGDVSEATIRNAAEFHRLTAEAEKLLLAAADNTTARLHTVTATALKLARETTEAEMRDREAREPETEDPAETSNAAWALLALALLGTTVMGGRLNDLRALMFFRAREASDRVGREILKGTREGLTAHAIAQNVLSVVGLEAQRALTMTRTEMSRAYREAVRLDLMRSPYANQGWTWIAVLDDRCCAICWANHGRTFLVTEPMPAHPRCRCRIVPTVQLPPNIKTGPDEFADLPLAEQKRILGPAATRAYKAGVIQLEDVAGVRRHPQWGQTGVRVPLRSLVGAERAKEFQFPR